MAAPKAFAGIDERLHHLFMPQIEALDMVPEAHRCGTVSRMRPGRGAGSAWLAGIGGDCLVTVLDLSVDGAVDLTSHSPGYFCMGAMSASSLETMPHAVQPCEAASLVMYRQKPGTHPYRLRSRTPYASRSVCFTPRFLKKLAFEQGGDIEAFMDELTRASQALSSPVLERMLRRLDGRAADSAATGFQLTALMAEAVSSLVEACEGSMAAKEAQGSAAASRLAADARALMARSLSKPLTLDAMARELCVSRAHLAATYKQETGRTVAADLRRMRMSKAKQLLAETGLPLPEVAQAVGYSRQSSFTEAFTRDCGSSPARWRQQHRS